MQINRISKSCLMAGALFLSSIVLPALFHPVQAWAQNSVVTGTVQDSSGAAVAAATIKAHNTKTGVETTVQSNSSGVFRIIEPPGVYDISVQKEGFKVAEFSNTTLTVDQTLTLNASLEVGAVTQVIEVSGQSVAPIDLQSGEVSNVVDQSRIIDMPLITRDPYSLVLLSPGVIQSNAMGGFSANGTRERNNNFLLDGVDNNDSDVPGIPGGLTPLTPDSTQEFRVITNNFNAQYGRDNGATIDIVTKSGTNSIHGDAYWFGRYDVPERGNIQRTAPNSQESLRAQYL